MKCPKCGKLLQSIFVGISSGFHNAIEIKDPDGMVSHWLVCNNPDCVDGKLNCATPRAEDIPF
jgi:hypothetical protein